MPIAVSVVPLSEVAWTNTWPRGREPDLDPVLGGGAGAPGDAYTYWWPPTASLSVAKAKTEVDVLGRDRRQHRAAGVARGGHADRARRARDVVVGSRAQQGVGTTGGGAVPVVDHGPAELVLGVHRGPGRLGDRPGEAVGVGERAVADGQHDRVAAGGRGTQGARDDAGARVDRDARGQVGGGVGERVTRVGIAWHWRRS